MAKAHPDWDTAFFLSRVNQYYFHRHHAGRHARDQAGGPQPIILCAGAYERAAAESPLARVYPMSSYRDAAAAIGGACGARYMETEIRDADRILGQLRRHFELGEVRRWTASSRRAGRENALRA
jgi:hypothetical protein